MKPEDFIIPVDTFVKEFIHHLDSHPRTILSARYGDGKSYFLSEVIKSQYTSQKYVFLTVYPVNYQVVDNKDIFESVKRDILFQLFVKGMLKEEYEITEQQAFLFCIQNKGLSLAEVLLPFLCDSGIAGKALGLKIPESAGKFIGAGIGVFKKISEAYEEYRKYRRGDDNKVEAFLSEMDNLPIYENDVITQIIRDNLKSWKEDNPDKKVVLLFEDMDRIDPAHIFRILNVLSAQMDNCYGYAVKPDYTISHNKFGFDNIVVVLDYNNLKSIFHHFYGQDTNFNGYIEKFSGKGIFKYSLEDNLKEYTYDYISSRTKINKEFIKSMLPPVDISSINVRKIVESIELAEIQILPPVQQKCSNYNISFLTLLVIITRLFTTDIAKQKLITLLRSKTEETLKYIGFAVLLYSENSTVRFREGEFDTWYMIKTFDDDGFALSIDSSRYYAQGKEHISGHQKFADYVFRLIGK